MTYMKTFKVLALSGVAAFVMASPVLAQGDAVNADDFIKQQKQEAPAQTTTPAAQTRAQTEIEKSLAKAKAELDDPDILAKKVALAKNMHDIRPTSAQVDSAVYRASLGLQPSDRQNFMTAMKGMLNYNAIERISMDAMVETYTLLELESMVEYYSKPEAKSASDKVPFWASKIQPEIANMIDKAMMRLKTGQ